MAQKKKSFISALVVTVIVVVLVACGATIGAMVIAPNIVNPDETSNTTRTTDTNSGSGSSDMSKDSSSDGKDSSSDDSKNNTLYSINHDEVDNGRISLNVEEAKAGDVFTACFTPDTGYSVSTYVVDGVSYDIEDAQKGKPYFVYDLVQKEGGTNISATFVANTYTVKLLDLERTKRFDSFTVTYDSVFTLPSTHSDVIGYSVIWRDSDLTRYESGQTWKIAKDVTLYASWRYDTYNLSLDSNGGTFSDGVTTIRDVVVGYDRQWSLPEPTRDGYTFAGWYDGNTLVASTGNSWTLFMTDKSLFAKWTGNTYKVSYDLNGGTLDDSAPTQVTFGEEYSLKTPTRDGYSFSGWAVNGSVISQSGIWKLSGNVTVVSQWSANESRVYLDANGGTNSGSSLVKVKYGRSWSFANPKREGYDFSGWYDGTTKISSSGDSWNISTDVNLKAEWTAQTYVISLDSGGGKLNDYSISVTFGQSYSLEIPTKDGYSFGGWTTTKGDSIPTTGVWTYSIYAIVLKANWNAGGINIYLNPNGGTIDGSTSTTIQSVKYENSYSLKTPSRVGYTFSGWYSQSSGGVKVETEGTAWYFSTLETTLYAHWDANSYDVMLNPNGGELNGSSSMVSKKLTYDSSYDLGTPTRLGYSFQGWYEGYNKISTTGSQWQRSESVSLTAMWDSKSITITLDANGGSLTGSSSISLKYNESYSISNPTRTGYKFDGWKTEDGTSVPSKDDHWTYSNSSIRLIAQWSNDSIAVLMDPGEGSSSVSGSSTTVYYEKAYDLSRFTPSRDGYTFGGWYLDSSYSRGVATSGSSWTYWSDAFVLLYAKWNSSKCKITFKLLGGSVYGSTSDITFNVDYGTYITLPTPTRDGYSFMGWVDTNGKSYSSGTWTNAYDTTLIAKWEDNQITVKLDPGQGTLTGASSFKVTYGGTYSISNPTRTDYNFLGWYLSSDYSGDPISTASGATWTYSTTDVTLYAKWQQNSVLVFLDAEGGQLTGSSYVILKYGSAYVLEAPTKSGYNFKFWYDESGKMVDLVGIWNYLPSSNQMTLRALWISDGTGGDSGNMTGSTYTMGKYPQTKVTDTSLASALTSTAGPLPTASNSQKWTSYGYYVSSKVTDFMWYQDVTYSGNTYRGVYFTYYRPYMTTYTASYKYSYQDDNGYSTGKVYWFKFESISWKVLDKSSGSLLVTEKVLDSQQYYRAYNRNSAVNRSSYDNMLYGKVYDNNYSYSDIRGWINVSFYDWAFTSSEKSKISTTTVDNSISSTMGSTSAYVSGNTSDKLFLLSFSEANNTNYFANNGARMGLATDYAKAQGVYANVNGYAYWWLRSPYSSSANYASDVNYDGSSSYANVYSTHGGVRPAMKIK